jgi:hypothetical protein
MSVVGPSRHFAAMRNLIATGAQRNLASRQLGSFMGSRLNKRLALGPGAP